MRIAFIGDSITEGFPGTSYVARVQKHFPHYTLINLGRRNDTVLSLYQRLQHVSLTPPVDLCFLWIGVNDIVCRHSFTYRVVRHLAPQQKAPTDAAFEATYRQVVAWLKARSKQVVALTLPFKGEDPASACNHMLDARSQRIMRIADEENIAAFDIRTRLRAHIQPQASGYLVQSATQALADAILLRTDAMLAHTTTQRGLHLTFDGLHLSPTGAELVANFLSDYITQHTP